ncbi:MAG: hypothetical protein M3155_09490 [Actinomycetota bacterium]|nr:hypothetical protein [Actinomycetota bacterium]
MTSSLKRWPLAGLMVAVSALMLAACGSSKKSAKPTKVAISISEAGKSAKYTVPTSIKGGLVNLAVTNTAKAPHSAQLVLIQGNHTTQEALKIISSNSNKTPSWLHAEGGAGQVAPGVSVTADVNLPAGKYVVGDFLGGPGSSGPPGFAEFRATAGKNGSLPTTSTTVTAATAGKDRYAWKISGSLKPGANSITFKSEGKDALHFIGAFRVTGKPSKAEILKFLSSNGNGPPPKFVDQGSFDNTAILDGGKSQTTQLHLSKPGTYVLFCPVTDRNGGKSHDHEGLLKTIQVK